MRIVLAITGASGAIYGIRLLETLREAGVETHLILSDWARKTIEMETNYTAEGVEALAFCRHDVRDMAAAVSSGSFRHDGMIIAPCSMKTLAGIAHGLEENLIIRAAGVTLKEQRRLALLVRETPLTSVHLENMLKLARLGALIMPPVPALYHRPRSLTEIYDHTAARVLDFFSVEFAGLTRRWQE